MLTDIEVHMFCGQSKTVIAHGVSEKRQKFGWFRDDGYENGKKVCSKMHLLRDQVGQSLIEGHRFKKCICLVWKVPKVFTVREIPRHIPRFFSKS